MRNMGIVVTGASALAGAGMLTLSRRAERVNEAFREVDTISSQVNDTQEEYGDLVSELNTEFGIQTDRLGVISALYQSVSAGVAEGEEAQREFLTTAGELATVGRVDLATTVDILSTSVNAYGEETEFAERSSNALFNTVQFGKTTMEELAPVMGRVTALGADMDASIEGLGASMAVLTRTGFESRIAATGLRAVLRGLMRPSEEMREILRDIALEQDLFADSMDEGSEQVRELASDYRDATEALSDLEQQQREARREIEENSLVIQEARLLQEAIERDAREEAEEVIQTEELRGQTYEELEETIEDYRFEVNQARVEEEQARLTSSELKDEVEELEQAFKEEIATAGDLEGGLGQLVVENQGFVSTLIEVRERAEDQGVAMDDLFTRTRGLQAALALLGDDGEELAEIFAAMGEGQEELDSQLDDVQDQFDLTDEEVEELKDNVQDVSEQFEDTQGVMQEQRDAMSRLGEAATDLGQIFNDILNERLQGFVDVVEDTIDRIRDLEEETKEQIGTFLVLATSIGLVLGPLLLFGGQIALIASAMGSAFIPFTLVAGSALGILAHGLLTAADDGEDAAEMFESMENVLSGLISFLDFLRIVFVEETLPGMRIAGQGIIDVFSEVFDELSDDTDEGGSLIRQFARLWGIAFTSIGNFLSDNSEEIAQFIAFIVDGFINDVIPAAVDLADRFVNDILPSIIDTAQDLVEFVESNIIPVFEDAWETFNDDVLPWLKDFFDSELKPAFESLGEGILDVIDNFVELAKEVPLEAILDFLQDGAVELLHAFTDLIDSIGNFLSENDELITFLIVAVTTFSLLSKAVLKIMPFIITLRVILSKLATVIVSAFAKFIIFSAKLMILGKSAITLKGILVSLGAAIALLGGPITIIIALISLLAAAWITDFGGMRDTLQPVVDVLVVFVNRIVNRLQPALWNLVESTSRFARSLFGLISAFGTAMGYLLNLGGGSVTVEMAFASLALMVDGLIDISVGFIQIMTGLLDGLSAIALLLQGDFSGAWDAAKDAVLNGVSGISNILKGGLKLIMSLLFGTIGVVGGLVMDLVLAMLSPFIWLYEKLVGNSIIPELISDIISAFISLPGDIISALSEGLLEIITEFTDFFEDLLETVFERAKDIPGQIADGIKDGLDALGDAADEMAGVVRDRLPFSPAKEGPMSKPYGPKSAGNTIASDTAEGIDENKDEVAESAEELADEYDVETEEEFEDMFGGEDVGLDTDGEFDDEDIGLDFDDGDVVGDDGIPEDDSDLLGEGDEVALDNETLGDMEGMGGQETKIIVDEHAVSFEEGAFQGVSDEELPEKVTEEVEESLQEILERIKASGGVTSRR